MEEDAKLLFSFFKSVASLIWKDIRGRNAALKWSMHIYFKIKHAPCCEDRVSVSLVLKRTSWSTGASLVAQMVKNLPAMQETWVRSLGWEDPLEKRNGNPLQYSCLENSMDKAWWARVHEATKSWTGLSNEHNPVNNKGSPLHATLEYLLCRNLETRIPDIHPLVLCSFCSLVFLSYVLDDIKW